jgi:hypothetical protein
MHAVLLSRPKEVTMSRRIAACACALALAVPAAASAMPPHDPASSQGGTVSYGDTKYDLQNAQDLNAGVAAKQDLKRLQAGKTIAIVKPADSPRAAVVSTSTDSNGWRVAAVIEAGILAAFAVGAAVLLTGRQRRAPGMGT